MNIFKIVLSSSLLSMLVACGGSSMDSAKNDSVQIVSEKSDYLIFGTFYGHCRGKACIATYKLMDGKLFEDTVDDYSHTRFDFQALNKYNQVKGLLSQVPTEILLQQPETIGCPDCADGGGIYIQLQEKGVTHSWTIDNNLANVPKELHNFVQSVQDNVNELAQKSEPTDDVMCPANFEPICVTEVVNGQEISNTYSNSCMYNKERKGTFVISTIEGSCE